MADGFEAFLKDTAHITMDDGDKGKLKKCKKEIKKLKKDIKSLKTKNHTLREDRRTLKKIITKHQKVFLKIKKQGKKEPLPRDLQNLVGSFL